MLCFCAILSFLAFSSVVLAADGAEVVRPGILTGNINLNNNSGVSGVPSGVYPAFVINGQSVYLPQTLRDTGVGFIFTDGAYTGASRVCTAYDFVTPTNGYLAFAADQYYRCNVALLGQTSNISSVSVLQVSGFHLVSIDGQSFTFYFDQDTSLSSVYWRLGFSQGFELNNGGNARIISFSFLNFQTLTGFRSGDDDTQSIKDAIDHQTDVIDSQGQQLQDKIEDQYSVTDDQKAEVGGFGESSAGAVDDKLGVLDYASKVSEQIVDLFSTDPGPANLTFPSFTLNVDGADHQVWSDATYNLSDLEEKFGPLLTAVRFATVGLCYFAFIRYLHGVYTSIVFGKTIEEATKE